MLPHGEDVPDNIIFSRYKLLLHLAGKCDLFLNGHTLPLCCLLNAYDIMAFVLIAEDAIDAKQARILLAECFKLLAVQDALFLRSQLAEVIVVRYFRLLA